MAGPFYVDDGGNSGTGLSWTEAETSIKDLDTAEAFANGEVVYFGADSVDGAAAGALTINGPASGCVSFISATQGSSPVSYAAASAYQINTGGTNRLTFDGGFAIYGMWIRSGELVAIFCDLDEVFYAEDTTFRVGANGQFFILSGTGNTELKNCTIDLTDDGTTNRTNFVFSTNTQHTVTCNGLSFINLGYRTGAVFGSTQAGINYKISGADFLCQQF
jgi:hypothetical protein